MPCNYSGFFDAGEAARYGIVDFDRSNAKAAWIAQTPMDCEERLVRQAGCKTGGSYQLPEVGTAIRQLNHAH